MQFGKGRFKTRNGLPAVVVRMSCRGGSEWFLTGAIIIANVLCIHNWKIDGKSISTNPDNDLVKL